MRKPLTMQDVHVKVSKSEVLNSLWFGGPLSFLNRALPRKGCNLCSSGAVELLLEAQWTVHGRKDEEMSMSVKFSMSPAYMAHYGGVSFGVTLISGCQNRTNPPRFDQYKRKLLRKMRKKETLAQISDRVDIYDQFFKGFGYECPLPKHLKRTIHSGFPKYNLMVDAHFMAEMCAGILVAVTDHDRFDGALTLDRAEADEICRGMGGREIRTKAGEIVLRDEKEIVCVLCQGADEKTRVTDNTRNVLFYAYAVPGIEALYLKEGLAIAAETMVESGNGTVESLEIY